VAGFWVGARTGLGNRDFLAQDLYVSRRLDSDSDRSGLDGHDMEGGIKILETVFFHANGG